VRDTEEESDEEVSCKRIAAIVAILSGSCDERYNPKREGKACLPKFIVAVRRMKPGSSTYISRKGARSHGVTVKVKNIGDGLSRAAIKHITNERLV